MTSKHSAVQVVAGWGAALVLTAGVACAGPEELPQSSVSQAQIAATAPFPGDSTSDSAMYRYARNLTYRLVTDSGSFRSDSASVLVSLDLCTTDGSTGIDYSAMSGGQWFGIGCVLRSGAASADYPYLQAGLSFIMVRRSAGNWQARVLGLTPPGQIRRMFVSSTNTRETLGPDARPFRRGPRVYLCYTCDRKACCPTNQAGLADPVLAQSEVENIASVW